MAAPSRGADSSAEPEMQEFHVVVPENVRPGQQFCARIGTDGPLMNVSCPDNCGPGTTLQVRLPKVALPRPKNLPNPHTSDSEQGEPVRIKDHRLPSECALHSNEGRCGASDVQEDGSTIAATQDPIPGPSAGGQDGGSRRTSGRARNSISYDENKWRIRYGLSGDSITVRQDIDLHADAGHTSMMPSIQRTASDMPDDGALHEQYGNARMQSFSAPASSCISAPASRGPAAGVKFDDIPPAPRDTRPLVSLSLSACVHHVSRGSCIPCLTTLVYTMSHYSLSTQLSVFACSRVCVKHKGGSESRTDTCMHVCRLWL